MVMINNLFLLLQTNPMTIADVQTRNTLWIVGAIAGVLIALIVAVVAWRRYQRAKAEASVVARRAVFAERQRVDMSKHDIGSDAMTENAFREYVQNQVLNRIRDAQRAELSTPV